MLTCVNEDVNHVIHWRSISLRWAIIGPTLIQRNYVYRYVGPSLGQCRTPTSFAHGGGSFQSHPVLHRHIVQRQTCLKHIQLYYSSYCGTTICMYVSHIRPTWLNGNRGKSIVRLWQSVYHNVPGSAPLRKHLNIFERNCLAVHEQSALWVMGAGPSEGHQGTAYHSSLRHFNIVLS